MHLNRRGKTNWRFSVENYCWNRIKTSPTDLFVQRELSLSTHIFHDLSRWELSLQICFDLQKTTSVPSSSSSLYIQIWIFPSYCTRRLTDRQIQLKVDQCAGQTNLLKLSIKMSSQILSLKQLLLLLCRIVLRRSTYPSHQPSLTDNKVV